MRGLIFRPGALPWHEKLRLALAHGRGVRLGEAVVVSRRLHVVEHQDPGRVVILSDVDFGRAAYGLADPGHVVHIDVFHAVATVDHHAVAGAVRRALEGLQAPEGAGPGRLLMDYFDLGTATGGGRITSGLDRMVNRSAKAAHRNHVHIAGLLCDADLPLVWRIADAVERAILAQGVELRRVERLAHRRGGVRSDDDSDLSRYYGDNLDSFINRARPSATPRAAGAPATPDQSLTRPGAAGRGAGEPGGSGLPGGTGLHGGSGLHGGAGLHGAPGSGLGPGGAAPGGSPAAGGSSLFSGPSRADGPSLRGGSSWAGGQAPSGGPSQSGSEPLLSGRSPYGGTLLPGGRSPSGGALLPGARSSAADASLTGAQSPSSDAHLTGAQPPSVGASVPGSQSPPGGESLRCGRSPYPGGASHHPGLSASSGPSPLDGPRRSGQAPGSDGASGAAPAERRPAAEEVREAQRMLEALELSRKLGSPDEVKRILEDLAREQGWAALYQGGGNQAPFVMRQLEEAGLVRREVRGMRLTAEGKELLAFLRRHLRDVKLRFRKLIRRVPGNGRLSVRARRRPGRGAASPDVRYGTVRGAAPAQPGAWLNDLAVSETVAAAIRRTYLERIEQGGSTPAPLRFRLDRRDVYLNLRASEHALHICLLIDASASMAGRRIMAAKHLARHLLVSTRDRIAVIAFQERDVRVYVPFTRDYGLVEEGLSRIQPMGLTPLAQGLTRSMELIRSSRVRRPLLLLITDGIPTVPKWSVDPLADALEAARHVRAGRIPFGCIGLQPSRRYLEHLAREAGGTLHVVDELSEESLITIAHQERLKLAPQAR